MCNQCKKEEVEPYSTMCRDCLKVLVTNAIDEHRDMQDLLSVGFNFYIPIYNTIEYIEKIIMFGFSTIEVGIPTSLEVTE